MLAVGKKECSEKKMGKLNVASVIFALLIVCLPGELENVQFHSRGEVVKVSSQSEKIK